MGVGPLILVAGLLPSHYSLRLCVTDELSTRAERVIDTRDLITTIKS